MPHDFEGPSPSSGVSLILVFDKFELFEWYQIVEFIQFLDSEYFSNYSNIYIVKVNRRVVSIILDLQVVVINPNLEICGSQDSVDK